MPQEKQWVFPDELSIPEDFQKAVGGHPLVAQTLYRRGYQTVASALAFLHPENVQPTPPEQLPDIEIAVSLLIDALKQQKHILVWGDFDVDGQTATTLLVEALRELGGFVSYHIPVRGKESHGITQAVLEKYLKEGFDLLLTCDTGISEHENIQFLRNAGIPVIVTDHHSLGESLPPAHAVVNPQRLPEDHPLATLPGVGVAYKLIEALFQAENHPLEQGRYQELAALGIVSDVARLKGDTRYILQKGLQNLRNTGRLGLQTLYKAADLNPLNLTETHIGFQIAPRMNAVGRLGDANIMVEFLTTEDGGRARVLGMQIEAMNAKRRFATRQVEQAAEALLQMSAEDRHSPAIVLHHPDWPGGVVGIVASRLVERYGKPALLLTGTDSIHGSARSVEGVNITEAIGTQSDLLNAYGGHPMAAGLSMAPDKYPAFKRGFLAAVGKLRERVEIVPKLVIDRVISPDEISLDFVEQMDRLAPFGPDNPPLNVMIPNLTLVSTREIGAYAEHRQVVAKDQDQNEVRFIWWNGGDQLPPEAQFDLVCRLSRTDYKGSPQVSAEWVDFRITEKGRKEIERRHFTIIDRRNALNPISELTHFLTENQDSMVWGEGKTPKALSCKGRNELEPVPNLVIWTAPPSQSVLDDAILLTKPKKVVVFGLNPNITKTKTFLERLGGLAKYAIRHKDGKSTLDELASACAVTRESVRIGLKLWEALGKLGVVFEEDQLRISAVDNAPNQAALEIYQSLVKDALEESQAYRAYFQKGDITNYLTGGKSS
ncbi:MAG: single-stranded-DNA-specific exonuclease RecJ [Chloroflexota bacterium]|nr:single-stranded-DNA-specific exonuclease RecJ [Chloroflexota bacterium]